jgi:hypothetical protein
MPVSSGWTAHHRESRLQIAIAGTNEEEKHLRGTGCWILSSIHGWITATTGGF